MLKQREQFCSVTTCTYSPAAPVYAKQRQHQCSEPSGSGESRTQRIRCLNTTDLPDPRTIMVRTLHRASIVNPGLPPQNRFTNLSSCYRLRFRFRKIILHPHEMLLRGFLKLSEAQQSGDSLHSSQFTSLKPDNFAQNLSGLIML